ncbi:MAG: hypothetical protein MPN21_23165 [Thermoanaerobaculia bacterium]|nr:hypothetical protein [Thermoanaerobaculia bacterium]
MKPRAGSQFSSCLLLAMLLGSPTLAQSALVAEGMVTPTDATTAAEIVVVQMRTATEVPGPPFVVSLDPPRLALSSQAKASDAPLEEPYSHSLGRLAARAWEVHGYGMDWRAPGSGPQFEGFSLPATFHVATGEVHPKTIHPVAGDPLALRLVGPGSAACAPVVDSVAVEGQPGKIVVHAQKPNCPSPQVGGPGFGIDVAVPPLAAGRYRVEVRAAGSEGTEVYAGASFRVVPPGEPRILDLAVEHDSARDGHNLVARIETPKVAAAQGCTSWDVSPQSAWAHGRDLYASFELAPVAVACGAADVTTHRFPLPGLETGLYRILAHRRQAAGTSEYWAQSKTLVNVEKLGHLIHDRFRVTVDWRDHQGQTGRGVPVPLGDEADSAIFYFFGENNWELLIKVLDGCSFNDRYWVFASASTDVEYTLKVEDLATGAQATYQNQLGQASPAITDTAAFATCE